MDMHDGLPCCLPIVDPNVEPVRFKSLLDYQLKLPHQLPESRIFFERKCGNTPAMPLRNNHTVPFADRIVVIESNSGIRFENNPIGGQLADWAAWFIRTVPKAPFPGGTAGGGGFPVIPFFSESRVSFSPLTSASFSCLLFDDFMCDCAILGFEVFWDGYGSGQS